MMLWQSCGNALMMSWQGFGDDVASLRLRTGINYLLPVSLSAPLLRSTRLFMPVATCLAPTVGILKIKTNLQIEFEKTKTQVHHDKLNISTKPLN